jgi:gamma-glutamyltranspeptidase / glutathione hydrolase
LVNPYNLSRQPVYGLRGALATSQPLAAQAGLATLQAGGNAVDAAIASAIALTVVEPTANGIGGDAFALVWDGQQLHGLNGSGRAPASLSLAAAEAAGLGSQTSLPQHGWWPVTVAGAPAAWRDLHRRFGRLPFAKLFEPAIYYAEAGFALSPGVAAQWQRAQQLYSGLADPIFGHWQHTFAPQGRAPRVGEVFCLPEHAQTLRIIAKSNAEDFYSGEIAKKIAVFAADSAGFITQADLAAHQSEWVTPISTHYRNHQVWETPPNGQGIAALLALNILAGFPLNTYPRDSVESLHLQIEAMKLAFADADAYVADPQHQLVPTKALLDPGYSASRRALIGDMASEPTAGKPQSGGTVYLCAADSDGMMVSYIQSNYAGFGSGVVVPGTGIALQNRGANFSLDPQHPNVLAPNKRPYHTIIPGFLTQNGRAVGPFGVMGGFMQPQGHLQMMVNTLDYGFGPQTSLDAPRWRWLGGKQITLEPHSAPMVVAGLRERGHQITVSQDRDGFGRGQIIWRNRQGVLEAASDSRADGCALVY